MGYLSRAVGGISVVTNLFAAATLVVALLTPLGVAANAMLVTSGVLLFAEPLISLVTARRRGVAPRPLMGTVTVARILTAMAALAVDVADGATAWTTTAVCLVCFNVIGENSMRRPVRSAVSQSANIPGWEVPLPSMKAANGLFVADLVAVALIVASAALGITQVPAIIAVSAGLVFAIAIGFQSIRYLYGRTRFEESLPEILDEIAPVFAFHWQAPPGTAYQAAMWLPYLDRIGVPYFVLVRTQANFAEVAKLTDAPVILRTSLEDLDPIVCKSLKTVFYVNTAVRNSHMIRFPHLTHIQLNHGDSDKIASVSPVFRQFDKNFVAGQAAIDRFAKHGVATRPDQFEIVGRPQLEHVLPSTGPIADIQQPTVLYSPTWSGFYDDSDYSSLPAGPAIVSALLARGCTVVFRPHPYARKHKANSAACAEIIELLAEDAKATGRAHLFGPVPESEMSVFDCFNAADAMVSDVSSVVSDFLISNKPFAMVAVSAHGEAFAEEFPLSEAAYVIEMVDGRPVQIEECLEVMLGADPKAERRQTMRDYYLGDAPTDQVVDRFVTIASRFLA